MAWISAPKVRVLTNIKSHVRHSIAVELSEKNNRRDRLGIVVSVLCSEQMRAKAETLTSQGPESKEQRLPAGPGVFACTL